MELTEIKAAIEEMGGAASKRFDKLEAELKAEQERADGIETTLQRIGTGGEKKDGPSMEAKAFESFVRKGYDAMPETERKSLSVSPDTSGGYLVAPQFSREIVKNLVLISPVRQVARVGNMTGSDIMIPKRTAAPTGAWVSEMGTRTETNSTYGQLTIVANEMAVYVDVSNKLLDDAAFDIQAEIGMDLATEFARLEAVAFLTGDGNGKPKGILSDTSVTALNSGSAATIADVNGQADGIMNMYYDLAAPYRARATWLMNGATLASVRKLKDSQNRYIWQPSLAAGQPETILGRPVLECPDMPNEGAGATPIALGDFNEGYRIYDRTAMSLLRDPFTQATSGIVRFHARRRVCGDVVKAEAIRKLTCAA